MDSLTQTYEERLDEIDAYLAFLTALEKQVQSGAPKLGGESVTSQQQKILYSTVYLLLYNLVEATATWCLEAITGAAAKNGWLPKDLTTELRREWIRFTARTHTDLNYQNRLAAAVDMCDRLVDSLPLDTWQLTRNAGNWDDNEIEAVTKRIGCRLRISRPVLALVKRPIRDDKKPLELVKYLRNRLAHGSMSFAECGDGITVDDLKEIKDATGAYLREVVAEVRRYIDGYEFIVPSRRPMAGAST